MRRNRPVANWRRAAVAMGRGRRRQPRRGRGMPPERRSWGTGPAVMPKPPQCWQLRASWGCSAASAMPPRSGASPAEGPPPRGTRARRPTRPDSDVVDAHPAPSRSWMGPHAALQRQQ
eukprot:5653226-Alexandrium_andersonii.AAC.1